MNNPQFPQFCYAPPFSRFQENLQQKDRANNDSNVKTESNILGSSHFGKLIKNLRNHGVECRCRAGDIRGE